MINTWVILRTHPVSGVVELVLALENQSEAYRLCELLGSELHSVQPLPVVRADEPVRVLDTWRCRARVVDGVGEVDAPERLDGASRLLWGNEVPGESKGAQADLEADRLAREVEGRDVRHFVAHAPTAERAEALARAAVIEVTR